jgi:hypothetical protein
MIVSSIRCRFVYVVTSSPKNPLRQSNPETVDSFLQQVRARAPLAPQGDRGRLMFALDATASREPLWDRACHIQAQMFEQTAALGGLDIQLAYYRGYGEFKAAPWTSRTNELLSVMTAIRCGAGQTQIARVLQHTIKQATHGQVNALVFVGDCVEEDPDILARLAGQLGILAVPVFLFQDGSDPAATKTFAHIAQLTRGAHCRFDAASAAQLRDLLCAVAVYAAGGLKALREFGHSRGGEALRLTRQLYGGR